jgi:hypothetical protein
LIVGLQEFAPLIKNVNDGKSLCILVGGEKAPFRFILSLGLSKYNTVSGIFRLVDIVYPRKDISSAIFEKLSRSPKGFIENVADDSRFMQDDMGVPDLISLRNSKKRDSEFIDCYVGRPPPYHGKFDI